MAAARTKIDPPGDQTINDTDGKRPHRSPRVGLFLTTLTATIIWFPLGSPLESAGEAGWQAIEVREPVEGQGLEFSWRPISEDQPVRWSLRVCQPDCRRYRFRQDRFLGSRDQPGPVQWDSSRGRYRVLLAYNQVPGLNQPGNQFEFQLVRAFPGNGGRPGPGAIWFRGLPQPAAESVLQPGISYRLFLAGESGQILRLPLEKLKKQSAGGSQPGWFYLQLNGSASDVDLSLYTNLEDARRDQENLRYGCDWQESGSGICVENGHPSGREQIAFRVPKNAPALYARVWNYRSRAVWSKLRVNARLWQSPDVTTVYAHLPGGPTAQPFAAPKAKKAPGPGQDYQQAGEPNDQCQPDNPVVAFGMGKEKTYWLAPEGDRDCYTFLNKAGGKYQFQLLPQSGTGQLDLVLIVYDEQGNQVFLRDATNDNQAEKTPVIGLPPGRYYVWVGSYQGTGAYSLRALKKFFK